MLNPAIILLIILGSAFVLLVLRTIYLNKKTDHFRKNVEVGMLCRFYVKEEKRIGVVSTYNDGDMIVTDEYNDIHLLETSEIYPV